MWTRDAGAAQASLIFGIAALVLYALSYDRVIGMLTRKI